MIARTLKDSVCRYKTMQGYEVTRKAGWDTHGLPVEIEVEKQLGMSGKQDIEKYGIKEFNEKCRESVFTYESMWRDMTKRMGYLDRPGSSIHHVGQRLRRNSLVDHQGILQGRHDLRRPQDPAVLSSLRNGTGFPRSSTRI